MDIKLAKKNQKKNVPEDFEYIPIPFEDGSLLMVDITTKEPLKIGFCKSCSSFVHYGEDYVISWRYDCRCHRGCCPDPTSNICKTCDVYLKLPLERLVKESIEKGDEEVIEAAKIDVLKLTDDKLNDL